VAADAASMAVDVAVIGGGLAGLTLARDVHRRGRTPVVLEAGPRLGGVIRSEHIDGVLVEGGPDAMLAQKPAALALCRELGLGDEIVSTESPRTAFVLTGGQLHEFPPDTRLGLPLTRAAADALTMLPPEARARVARDFDAPAPPATSADESVGAFTTRRFGEAFTRLIAQPLLGGIHAGDVDRLSLRALFPPLADADAIGGSPHSRRGPGRRTAKAPSAACAAAWGSSPRRLPGRSPGRRSAPANRSRGSRPAIPIAW
jgi:oxygen-dependent protoporphyrinogen oxidase